MKELKIIIILFLVVLFINSCEKEEIDKEKPAIDLNIQNAFPVNCDTLYFGETFTFRVLFTDNAGLGSDDAYSMDIHHNFDHHSHSTEVTECQLSEEKDAVNPFTYIQDFSIPEGLKVHETDKTVTIPASNSTGMFDEGDYHFFISVTDKEGWTAQKGLSIKILYRQ